MPVLSFSALLPDDMDSEMSDVSLDAPSLPTIDIPLHFDFDFELDGFDTSTASTSSSDTDADMVEPRSPRTPTYTGGSFHTSSASPFNPDRFFTFPLVTVSHELSPLAMLACSPAAKSYVDLPITHKNSEKDCEPTTPSPPVAPLVWIWTCHLCRSRYPLGATRRCLVDGHLYCSGDNSAALAQKNVKRKKRGQSCSSEFDYVGWQEWGKWRKQVLGIKKRPLMKSAQSNSIPRLRGCQRCEYPSQCRYEKMNKIPDVVAAVSAKGVGRELEDVSPVVSTKKSKGIGSKKPLQVDSGHISITSDHGRKHDGVLLPTGRVDNTKPESSDPTSPDLVDFSSMVESAVSEMEDASPETKAQGYGCVSQPLIGTDPDDGKMEGVEAHATMDTAALTVDTPSTISIESWEKKRPCEQFAMTQSRISDFFEITK